MHKKNNFNNLINLIRIQNNSQLKIVKMTFWGVSKSVAKEQKRHSRYHDNETSFGKTIITNMFSGVIYPHTVSFKKCGNVA